MRKLINSVVLALLISCCTAVCCFADGTDVIDTVTTTPKFSPIGNIGPYRLRMYHSILKSWKLEKREVYPKIQITVAKNGHLDEALIIEKSGDKNVDERAINAVNVTKFEALPEWYKGENLTFKVDFKKIADVDSNATTPAIGK